MSFQEKRSLAHLFSIVLVAVGFYVYVFQWNAGEAFGDTGSYAFWAWALLAVIPVQIATHIVITILFVIFEMYLMGGRGPEVNIEHTDSDHHRKGHKDHGEKQIFSCKIIFF